MQDNKANLIVDKSFQFALKIVAFAELLEASKKYVISRQLLKSGASVGANIREAQNAESKLDFIHKMKIAAKEADETQYWLMLCKHSTNYPNSEELLVECSEVIKIRSKIIATSKQGTSQLSSSN